MKTRNYSVFKRSLLIIFYCIFIHTTEGQWVRDTIDFNLDHATSFKSADLDNDGDEDLIAALYGQKDIVWYENDNLSWNKHMIDENLGAVGIFYTDLDGDEKSDVIVAGHASNQVKWYKNMGGDPIEWKRSVIDYNLGGAEFVCVADLDSDGDNDVVATGVTSDMVVWYENDGTAAEWTKHIIETNLDGAVKCMIEDIDSDGSPDVVVNGMYAGILLWYKNSDSGQTWTKSIIENTLPGTSSFDIADLDNDNDPDIVVTATTANDVIYYENIAGDQVSWNKHIIDDNLVGAFCALFSDMDNDGDLDAVATAKDAQDVVWYINDGNSPDSWTKFTIDSELPMAWDLLATDLNGDNYPDLIVNQFIPNGSIVYYINQGVGSWNKLIWDNKFILYPNPASHIINIQGIDQKAFNLEIYSVSGQRILKKHSDGYRTEIDISGIGKGMYFITIRSGNQVWTEKIIKN